MKRVKYTLKWVFEEKSLLQFKYDYYKFNDKGKVLFKKLSLKFKFKKFIIIL